MYACACVVSVCDECCYYCFQTNNVQIAVRVWFAGVCVCACVCVCIIDELWHIHEHVSTKSRSRGMAGSSWRQPGTAKAQTPLHHAAQKV